ncbi:MAG: hypothetical protein J6S43_05335 [Lentisphaeria bacterium]|nr:hypothetical protein [Lentisphaeria bacterium]
MYINRQRAAAAWGSAVNAEWESIPGNGGDGQEFEKYDSEQEMIAALFCHGGRKTGNFDSTG